MTDESSLCELRKLCNSPSQMQTTAARTQLTQILDASRYADSMDLCHPQLSIAGHVPVFYRWVRLLSPSTLEIFHFLELMRKMVLSPSLGSPLNTCQWFMTSESYLVEMIIWVKLLFYDAMALIYVLWKKHPDQRSLDWRCIQPFHLGQLRASCATDYFTYPIYATIGPTAVHI